MNRSTVDADNDLVYFVECTLHYPIEIRKHTKDFPLCAENKIITYDMLSEYQKNSEKSIWEILLQPKETYCHFPGPEQNVC